MRERERSREIERGHAVGAQLEEERQRREQAERSLQEKDARLVQQQETLDKQRVELKDYPVASRPAM